MFENTEAFRLAKTKMERELQKISDHPFLREGLTVRELVSTMTALNEISRQMEVNKMIYKKLRRKDAGSQ